MSDLMQKLAMSKKIMEVQDRIPRGQVNGQLPMNENVNYNIPQDMVQQPVPQHPDALADGDTVGRGTGSYLDIYNQNAGTKEDVQLRNDEIKINRYSASKPYYVSDEGSNARPMANL